MDSCCDPTQDKNLKPSQATIDENKAYQEATSFRVPQMDCPTEISAIQGKLESVRGVGGMKFDLEKRILVVKHDGEEISSNKIVELLDAIGLKASVYPFSFSRAGRAQQI